MPQNKASASFFDVSSSSYAAPVSTFSSLFLASKREGCHLAPSPNLRRLLLRLLPRLVPLSLPARSVSVDRHAEALKATRAERLVARPPPSRSTGLPLRSPWSAAVPHAERDKTKDDDAAAAASEPRGN